MCLYPAKLTNKKYTATKKNGGCIPSLPKVGSKEIKIGTIQKDGIDVLEVVRDEPIYDRRVLTIEAPCGRCIECCQAKAREWQVRLTEELKDWKDKYKYFVTFTFSPKGLREICFKYRIKESNAAAAFALRHSLERYRKATGKSFRHWFVTELGDKRTERIHLHGVIFMNEPQEFEKIEEKPGKGWMCKWKYWKYGHIFVGDYVNQRSINYVVKYMEKIDEKHKTFMGQVLCSPGIGKRFIEYIKLNGDYSYTYRPHQTKDFYRLPNGCKVKLPKYYSNNMWTEEEREMKWRDFMDMNVETIRGYTYYLAQIEKGELLDIRDKAQEVNNGLGFGSNNKAWKRQPYNLTKRMLQDQQREKAEKAVIGKPMG